MDEKSRKQVAAWLLVMCALLFTMVVIGGITRLTRSGLSIVEWQPVVGIVPPLDEAQWHEAFEKYKATPEYEKVNFDMTLEQFKGIFWWEYVHRLLGRLIGLGFLLPYLAFLLRRKLDLRNARRLGLVFLLGAAQGFMGWYMVMSGLVDDPRVSQYRLTAHLGLAFAILAAMLWIALDMLAAPRTSATEHPRLARASLALVGLVFLMVLTGGLVAGIRAGYAYNTFPLMNGHFVPPEIFLIDPWYANFFNNMATVQFDHRMIAWTLMLVVPLLVWSVWRAATGRNARVAALCLLGALALQVTLGITTLLLRVPVALGAAHQAGAVLVFCASLWLAHSLRGPRAQRQPSQRLQHAFTVR